MADSPKPVMWKPDPLDRREFLLEISQRLHREAGIRGFSCMPKASSITQYKTYYAEVMQHSWPGRPEGSGQVRYNVSMGTGATPLRAAMNGYQLCGLNDPVMKVIYLEIEAYYLAEAVKTYGRLELALEDLTEVMGSLNVPPEELQAATELVQSTEDDDL